MVKGGGAAEQATVVAGAAGRGGEGMAGRQ